MRSRPSAAKGSDDRRPRPRRMSTGCCPSTSSTTVLAASRQNATATTPQFRRFVESQQIWDRAMAEALAAAAKQPGAPLAVGLMGSRHIIHGHGVPHQLKDLGESELATLVPWDRSADCKDLVAGYADAVFGLAAPLATADRRPRLGVYLEPAQDGVRVARSRRAASPRRAASARATSSSKSPAGRRNRPATSPARFSARRPARGCR